MPDFQNAVSDIVESRKLMSVAVHAAGNERRSAWCKILAHPSFWSVHHEDEAYSVLNMSYADLEASILEDLICCEIARRAGADAFYPLSQLSAHLGSADRPDVRRALMHAFEHLVNEGFIVGEPDSVYIPENMIEEAQNISGVIITDDFSRDILDDMLIVGGSELVADTLEDICSDKSMPHL